MVLPEPVPDPRSLDLLMTVGRVGSISAAAAEHGITQPAASMRIRGLERVLGLRLLDRSPGGASLTAAGAVTAGWAEAVLRDLAALLSSTAALRSDAGSHLHLAASHTVAEYLLPAWLQRLAAEVPDVRVSLEMGNSTHVATLVASGQATLGFVEGPTPPRGLRSRALADDELVVVVGPGHPWVRRRRPLSGAELAAARPVLREEGSGTRELLVSAMRRMGLGVTPSLELGSTTAIKAAVAGGAGPGVLSGRAVAAEVADGRLVAVPTDVDLHRRLRAVWAADRPPTGAAARLLALAG